jgi:hypothetical protein
LPKEISKLASVRNKFSHYQQQSKAMDEATKCTLARGFIRDVIEFAKAMKGSEVGLFPVIVHINSINVDRWGRTTIVAFRDDGVRETIFTDQQLEAGRTYLMHPTTNPIRVDPILVHAGKMWGLA